MDIDVSSLLITNVRAVVAPPRVLSTDRIFDPKLDQAVIAVIMDVHDRDTGAKASVCFRDKIEGETWEEMDEPGRAWAVRCAVIRAITHEVLEHFKVNGVRRFDPHVRETL